MLQEIGVAKHWTKTGIREDRTIDDWSHCIIIACAVRGDVEGSKLAGCMHGQRWPPDACMHFSVQGNNSLFDK